MGLFASLRQLLGTALALAQVRLELLGTEFELEKRRILSGLFWAALALMMLGLGILLLCGFILLLFWEDFRLAAAAALTCVSLGLAVFFLYKARSYLHLSSHLFEKSVAEIESDRTHLKSAESI